MSEAAYERSRIFHDAYSHVVLTECLGLSAAIKGEDIFQGISSVAIVGVVAENFETKTYNFRIFLSKSCS